MKTFGILLVLAAAASGQYRGSTPAGGVRGPGMTTTTGGGFGNVLFPGGYVPGQQRTSPGVRGFPAGPPGRRGNHGSGVVFVPYAYPYYLYDQQTQEAAAAPQPAPAPTTIIINNNYVPERSVGPVVRDYNFEPANSGPPGPSDGLRVYNSPNAGSQSSDERPTVLIAFKDHTIYAALTYWLEGETLHYVTTHGTHNQVSLGLIDRELTERLNRERGVDFRVK
jgi:hypothetical protein